ncbi:MAG: glycosyltransferase family 2 protein [Parachlamydia sp.]|jgi:glycosyltransferase involved in cell wall biosynthesis|nr:glycosyltransferase family 2 protein [Parachlamydia sp.]
MANKLPITVTILTKNSQQYLEEVLLALNKFEEVLIADTGSTDQTLSIAHKFPNVTVHRLPFEGFGPTHNKASALARNDWILSIDSDEVLTPELFDEIARLKLDSRSVYSMPRRNEYRGKWIKWCGWHPDRQVRLYHRQGTRFTDAQVHESVMTQGMQLITLHSPLRHYSYTSVEDFLSKMQAYSTLFAQQNQGKKSSSFSKALSHGLYAFFKSYFVKKGVLGGREGFEISFYNAATAYYKYLKLAELNNKTKLSDRP